MPPAMSPDLTQTPQSPRPPGDVNPRTEPVLDFPDRSLGELSAEDYRELGFMAGLEVHQQALTRSKLFCRCPAGERAPGYDAEVLRHMRPTLSELGEYDGTALMEFKTRKEIVYRLHRGTVCTYEIDDTPPFLIDPAAVDIALEVAMLFNLQLVSELHVMRKQYLDGSIPTGFQRTAMIGLRGAVPFRVPELGIDRELSIRQLSLEEDSGRELSDVGHRITFATDRLGTPLTEVVTEPELLNPLELQAAAHLIARGTQATGKVRRGPGAARQDVNVSIAGGRRVEIKGVDRHRALPRLVHNEAYRQLNLLRIKHELLRRGVPEARLELPIEGHPWEVADTSLLVTSTLRRCNYAPIHDAIENGQEVCALKLVGFGGILTRPTQPGVTFSRELAGRVRVIACLESRPFMLHSDLSDYGLGPNEWSGLRRALSANEDDCVIVVWGSRRDVATAAREIFARAREALDGVPAETRQAFRGGTTSFERILPGPDRMYPDTDTPPLPIADARIASISAALPECNWDREQRYVDCGLSQAAARRLAAAPWRDLFDALAPERPEGARRLAAALEKRLPHHRRRSDVTQIPSAERLAPLLQAIEAGDMRAEALEAGLDALLLQPGEEPDSVLARFKAGEEDAAALARALDALRGRLAELAENGVDVALRWGVGQIMYRFMGRVDPVTVRQQLAERLDS